MIPSNDLLRPDNQEVRRQHENWAGARARLFRGPPPAEKPARPIPVSPFIREARERRQAQREAFDRQMLNAKAGIEMHVVHVDRGWPPYTPPLPYDHCGPSLPHRERITMREIIRDVAAKYGVTVNDILSPRRHKPVVVARHEAMWRCKQETTNSLPQIGRAIGGRDHTTALAGIRRHELRMANGEV